MKKSKILLMAVALIATMVMVACGSDNDAETMPQGGTVIDQTKLYGGWCEVERRQVNADVLLYKKLYGHRRQCLL